MTLKQVLFFCFYIIPLIMNFICLTILYIKSYIAANKLNELFIKFNIKNKNNEEFGIMVDLDPSSTMDYIYSYLLSFIPFYNIYYMACNIEDLGKYSIKDIIKDYIHDLNLETLFKNNGIDVEDYL